MIIKQPLIITSRLLPGVKIGEATISIEYAHREGPRQCFRWFIDNGNGHRQDFQGNELSTMNGGSLQEGLESLLSFLGAFAEACNYDYPDCGLEQENTKLFPRELASWATTNADEFTSLEMELQEHPGEYIQE